MKNEKIKLSVVMMFTTMILFLISFLGITYYQKTYIFDKAIMSIENEIAFIEESFNEENMDENSDISDTHGADRLYYVETLFLDYVEDFFYFSEKEKQFIKLYTSGELVLDEISKVENEFGEFYVLLTKIEDIYHGEGDESSEFLVEEMPVLLYTDISISTNIVRILNKIFYVMLVVTVVIEGVVGMYLGAAFENSKKKLKHFFQNASHELKSPLMSIQGYAEGIYSGVVKDTKMASEVIIKKSKMMKVLIDEILNISKLDSGEYSFQKEIFDIRDLIDESLENFTSELQKRELKVEVEYNTENNEVYADALQMYKAINTVIDNAVKFAFSTVSIKTQVYKKQLSISIYNDGEKIQNQDILHIFDRFYSANNFSTGIGLAMAKEIITLSKGSIQVKNLETGVLFIIKLPQK